MVKSKKVGKFGDGNNGNKSVKITKIESVRKNNTNIAIVNIFRGYYLEDCACDVCPYFRGKARGCKLDKCCCEEEKIDAIANGRIKRRRGALVWDG